MMIRLDSCDFPLDLGETMAYKKRHSLAGTGWWLHAQQAVSY
jgi:hypothetical protein